MEPLGEYLRRQRELKGLSLRDISDKTRIGISYLRYIEENQFDRIPGEIFLKGFLRLYAKALGLQEKEILERYNLLYEKKDQEEEIEQEVKKERYYRFVSWLRHRKLPSWAWAIPVLLIVILLFQGLPKKRERPTLSSKEVNKITKPASPTSPTSSTILPTEIPQELTLSIEAVEETWIKILIDGDEVREALLKAGDSVNFNAKKNFGLTIGNAGGINIKFNGKELKTLGPSGKVIKDLILSKENKAKIIDKQ
ncbi:MAG: helix-turn-helix domain-containing protein [Nitrospirae bacterium]|nr:helix-turn-helix domain-containing protein [Nitrospirota bacterium]